MKIRIGSRASQLAIVQAEAVAALLKKAHAALEVEFVRITTRGDQQTTASLKAIGGKGVFVKEIEDALLAKKIDLAVHSLKDVPQQLPDGLVLGPCPEREDNRDAIISRFGEQLHELPRGSNIGTSSPRRQAQIFNRYKKKYRLTDIRGNVDTRLKKLQNGDYDSIVVAAAGLKRLGLSSEISQILDYGDMLPAPCQGCLGLEVRDDDQETMALLQPLRHAASDITARAERAFLRGIGGDCTIPLGGAAKIVGETLEMEAVLLDPAGEKAVRSKETGPASQPDYVGSCLAERILFDGGSELLK
jgi:hydroxymethylbilane synthase